MFLKEQWTLLLLLLLLLILLSVALDKTLTVSPSFEVLTGETEHFSLQGCDTVLLIE